MKRWNAQSNVIVSRLGILSFVALMILNLSSGLALGAEEGTLDFKRWKRVEGKQQPALELIKDEEKKSSNELLSKNDEESFKGWVKSFNEPSKENPVKLIQSAFNAAKEAIKADKFSEFHKAFFANMAKVTGSDVWGKTTKGASQEEILKAMLTKLFGKEKLSKDEMAALVKKLEKMDEQELLSSLFDFTANGQLALDDTKEKEIVEPAKGLTQDDLDKALAKLKEEIKPKETGAPEVAKTGGDQNPPPGGQQPGGGLPGGILPGATGEVYDQRLTPAEEAECDRLAKLRKDGLARLDGLRNELLATAAQVEGLSRRSGVEDLAKADDNLGQDLQNALGNLLNKDDQQSPFFQPPPAAQAPVAAKRKKNSAPFTTPPPQGEPEQPPPPMQWGQNNQQQAPIEVAVDIPVTLGQAESREAQTVLREAEAWKSSPLSKKVTVASSRQKIMFNKNLAEARQKRIATAARNARDAAADMEEQLAALSKGAETKLKKSTKEARDNLQTEIANLQRTIEQEKAKGGSVGGDLAKRQELTERVGQLEATLNSKMATMQQVQAKIKSEVETGDENIKLLAQRFKKLNQNATALESERDAAASEVALIEDTLEQRTAWEQSQTQVAVGGSRSVYQGAQGNGAPRSVPPRGVNSRQPQVGNLAGGTEQRKPLSK